MNVYSNIEEKLGYLILWEEMSFLNLKFQGKQYL